MLEIGLRSDLVIREERLSASTDACQLLYVSDIHLRPGRSEQLTAQVLDAASRCQPHAVLLGGDLVDRASELAALRKLVKELTLFGPVLAVAGNHDVSVGVDRVRDAVQAGGGRWIDDDCYSIQHTSRSITVFGPHCRNTARGDVRVLCAHNPRIWKRSAGSGYDLVLAGHLHGCQFVAFEYRDRLYPGAFFYPYNFVSHQRGRSRLVVSRGVSDLAPIRWRCPREVVLCHV